MEGQYSTLELTKHDQTARAPERDYDATAFELDPDALAPQVVPDTTPQVVYDSSAPEAQNYSEDDPTENASSHLITRAALKWLLTTVALGVAAIIAIAAGVGTWYHREHSHRPSPISSPPDSSPPAPKNDSFAPAEQHILNDTSLAALILANGDRQLYFQDITGRIRWGVRTVSNSQWNTSPSFNISSGPTAGFPVPKNNTPLTYVLSEGDDRTSVEVYYVSDQNYISSSIAEGGSLSFPIHAGKNYSTAVGTRALSIASVPGSNPDNSETTENLALLYYENSAGNVSALLQRSFVEWHNTSKGSSTGQTESHWLDITNQSAKSLPSDFLNVDFDSSESSHTLWESEASIKLRTPFTSMTNFSDTSTTSGIFSIGALFYAPDSGLLVSDFYSIGLQGPGNYSSSGFDYLSNPWPGTSENVEGPNQRYSPIQQSDVAVFGSENKIWINGTQPVTSGGAPPNISFPFTRLASVNSADQSMTFLYHQINGTTLAEEQWDNSERIWLPSQYITVSES